jgi:poly-gamma-glutamate synthesis protein (capsule biosynthesis protein)
LPLESYKGRPIFYGLGSFSFHTGHGGRKHGDWVGMMAHVGFIDGKLDTAAAQFVRHNDDNETFVSPISAEGDIIAKLVKKSAASGARVDVRSERLQLSLHEPLNR